MEVVVVISRPEWFRGHGGSQSRLCRPDGMKCCIGFLSIQTGLGAAGVTNITTVDSLIDKGIVTYNELPEPLRFLIGTYRDRYNAESSVDGSLLMKINDCNSNPPYDELVLTCGEALRFCELFPYETMLIGSDEKRERLITKIMAEHGVTVRFEGPR